MGNMSDTRPTSFNATSNQPTTFGATSNQPTTFSKPQSGQPGGGWQSGESGGSFHSGRDNTIPSLGANPDERRTNRIFAIIVVAIIFFVATSIIISMMDADLDVDRDIPSQDPYLSISHITTNTDISNLSTQNTFTVSVDISIANTSATWAITSLDFTMFLSNLQGWNQWHQVIELDIPANHTVFRTIDVTVTRIGTFPNHLSPIRVVFQDIHVQRASA